MRTKCLSLLGMLALSVTSLAEPYEFKVVYAHVPGIEKTRVGDFEAVIAILESHARDPKSFNVPGELATLCALYVVTGKLENGRKTCDAAVDLDESDIAYNNRGVLRARLGDAKGALEDFDRVRVLPDELLDYFEDLRRRDARLMASRNYVVVTEYIENLLTEARADSGQILGANIEDLNN